MEEIFINIDSKYRDKIAYPNETKFRINLEKTYKNIVSVTINSLEINNNINYISSKKDNNYVTIHLPNKLNDPDGTKIILYEGLLQLITSIKTIFNGIFTGIFNNNGSLQKLSYNDRPFVEKYFYIFYLNDEMTINFDFNLVPIHFLMDPLKIPQGWHSLYGLVIQISNYIRNKYNQRKAYINQYPNESIPLDYGNFTITSNILLKIFDRRLRNIITPLLDCIRLDNISAASFLVNDLENNLSDLKKHIYKTYIKDIHTFISSPSGIVDTTDFGILDFLTSGNYIVPPGYVNDGLLMSNSKYYISNSVTNPNSDTTQIYNISHQVDLTGLRVFFKNSFTNIASGFPNYFYYYYVDPNGNNPSAWKRDEDNITINYFQNLLDLNHLLSQKFISQADYDNPLFNPTLEKDIADFEIDFNTSKNLENPVTHGLVDIKKIEYPSIGHYMGFRANMFKTDNKFLKKSVMDDTDRIIRAEKCFDTAGENYIFIKINNWGYIDFFGEKLMAKILLTSGLGNPKLDSFVNQGYRFRQPINVSKFDIELVDWIGNTLDLNGFDISCSIKLMQVISADQKDILEKQSLYFNY
jgi:hypothetical protein